MESSSTERRIVVSTFVTACECHSNVKEIMAGTMCNQVTHSADAMNKRRTDKSSKTSDLRVEKLLHIPSSCSRCTGPKCSSVLCVRESLQGHRKTGVKSAGIKVHRAAVKFCELVMIINPGNKYMVQMLDAFATESAKSDRRKDAHSPVAFCILCTELHYCTISSLDHPHTVLCFYIHRLADD